MICLHSVKTFRFDNRSSFCFFKFKRYVSFCQTQIVDVWFAHCTRDTAALRHALLDACRQDDDRHGAIGIFQGRTTGRNQARQAFDGMTIKKRARTVAVRALKEKAEPALVGLSEELIALHQQGRGLIRIVQRILFVA